MNHLHEDRPWPFARGSEQTLGLLGLALAALFAMHNWRPSTASRLLLILASALGSLILYFFRDPNREAIEAPGLVVSAADGQVVEIAREYEDTYLRRGAIRISVFLSILDVHVQRVPVSGTVRSVEHKSGKFLQAFRPEASTANEHMAMLIETDDGPILVKQIAGILARRCVNYATPGTTVRAGQRFGLIRFGSRVDLFLPPSAEVLVAVGDKVKGAVTPVARLDTGK